MSWFGRLFAAGFLASFVAMGIIWAVARGPIGLHLLVLLPVVAAVVPLQIARSRVVLTADCL
jgi:hypothetical protein